MALSARPGRAIGDARPFRALSRRTPGRRHGTCGAAPGGAGLTRPAAKQQCPPVSSGAPRLIERPQRSA